MMAIGSGRRGELGGVIIRFIRIDPMNELDIEEISLGTDESYFANFKIDCKMKCAAFSHLTSDSKLTAHHLNQLLANG